MKKLIRHTLIALVVAVTPVAIAAPAMDVLVVDAHNNLAFRGTTDTDGTFSTGTLRPGNYVVQFNAKDPSVTHEKYAIVVGAGRHKVSADAVEGEKFAAGGVAMRVKVSSGTRIVGQVATGGAEALGVKVVNGHRYILALEGTGTNIGPRWVEEGTQPARNIILVSRDAIRDLQDRGSGQNR